MQRWIFLILMGFSALSCGADMYRWVDDKGVVNYTPYPPPANVKKVEQKKLGDPKVQAAETAPGTQAAAKTLPVTFYSTPDCDTCRYARAHLEKRGVSYTEKNPTAPGQPDDFENFRKLSNNELVVPLLQVGQLKPLIGYLPSEWDATLDQAGFPNTAKSGAKPAAKPGPGSAPPAAAK